MSGQVGWDYAEKRAAESAGGKFVDLKETGDTALGVFVGDPYTEELYYDDKKEAYEPYTEDHKKAGLRPSPRFYFNFAELAAKGSKHDPQMKIVEMNGTSFDNVVVVKKKYGMDRLYQLECKVTEKNGNKKRVIHVLPEIDPLSDEMKAAIGKLQLHDLKNSRAGNAATAPTNGGAAATNGASADPVVDKATGDKIVERLKALPNSGERVPEWQKKFGIQKVREIRQSQLAEALATLDNWEGKKPEAAPAAEDAFG